MEQKGNYETTAGSLSSIYKNSASPEEACREIISFLSDDKYEEQIQDESNPLSKIYDLSIQYLDKDYASKKDQIDNKIQNILDNLA